jgi:hypothetical protein
MQEEEDEKWWEDMRSLHTHATKLGKIFLHGGYT